MEEKKYREYVNHEILFLNKSGLKLVLDFIKLLKEIQKKYEVIEK